MVNQLPDIERAWPAHLEPIKNKFPDLSERQEVGRWARVFANSRGADSSKPPLHPRVRRRAYLEGWGITAAAPGERRKSLAPKRRKSLDPAGAGA